MMEYIIFILVLWLEVASLSDAQNKASLQVGCRGTREPLQVAEIIVLEMLLEFRELDP